LLPFLFETGLIMIYGCSFRTTIIIFDNSIIFDNCQRKNVDTGSKSNTFTAFCKVNFL